MTDQLDAEAMDVLACIPLEPVGAVKREIAYDVYGDGNIPSRRRVQAAMGRICRTGIEIRKLYVREAEYGAKTQYAIAKHDWPAVRAMLANYSPEPTQKRSPGNRLYQFANFLGKDSRFCE